jgi:hypothetical protein
LSKEVSSDPVEEEAVYKQREKTAFVRAFLVLVRY